MKLTKSIFSIVITIILISIVLLLWGFYICYKIKPCELFASPGNCPKSKCYWDEGKSNCFVPLYPGEDCPIEGVGCKPRNKKKIIRIPWFCSYKKTFMESLSPIWNIK